MREFVYKILGGGWAGKRLPENTVMVIYPDKYALNYEWYMLDILYHELHTTMGLKANYDYEVMLCRPQKGVAYLKFLSNEALSILKLTI